MAGERKPDIQPDITALVSRIETLETNAAYRDQAVEDLNNTITAQWKEIDALKRQLERMADRLSEAEAAGDRVPDPPPPHY